MDGSARAGFDSRFLRRDGEAVLAAIDDQRLGDGRIRLISRGQLLVIHGHVQGVNPRGRARLEVQVDLHLAADGLQDGAAGSFLVAWAAQENLSAGELLEWGQLQQNFDMLAVRPRLGVQVAQPHLLGWEGWVVRVGEEEIHSVR